MWRPCAGHQARSAPTEVIRTLLSFAPSLATGSAAAQWARFVSVDERPPCMVFRGQTRHSRHRTDSGNFRYRWTQAQRPMRGVRATSAHLATRAAIHARAPRGERSKATKPSSPSLWWCGMPRLTYFLESGKSHPTHSPSRPATAAAPCSRSGSRLLERRAPPHERGLSPSLG